MIADWDLTIAVGGEKIFGTIKFEDTDNALKGKIVLPMGEMSLLNVEIKDNSFFAEIILKLQEAIIEGTANGKIEAGKLTCEIDLPNSPKLTFSGIKKEKK